MGKWCFAIVNTADPFEIAALTAELHLAYGDDSIVLNRHISEHPFDMNDYLRRSLDNIIVADAVIKGKRGLCALPFGDDRAEDISHMENDIVSALNKPTLQEMDLIRKIIIKEYEK